jgi:hypothetical protein
MNSGVRVSGVRKGLAWFALDFWGVDSMLRLGSVGPIFSTHFPCVAYLLVFPIIWDITLPSLSFPSLGRVINLSTVNSNQHGRTAAFRYCEDATLEAFLPP